MVEQQSDADLPDGRAYGIRLSLADVKGISDAEVQRIVASQQYFTLADFWHRAQVSRPVVERLVMAGGFDSLYGLGRLSSTLGASSGLGPAGEGDPTRSLVACGRARPVDAIGSPIRSQGGTSHVPGLAAAATRETTLARATSAETRDVRLLAAAQSQGGLPVIPARAQSTQLTLDLGDTPELTMATGLPEMTGPERVRAELDILGLDASAHIIDFYAPMLQALR